MPRIELREEPLTQLPRHAAIPCVFESNAVLDVMKEADVLTLKERILRHPHRKNYDLLEDPLEWPKRFDVSNWVLIAACEDGQRIGGAIAAFDTPECRGLPLLCATRLHFGASRSRRLSGLAG